MKMMTLLGTASLGAVALAAAVLADDVPSIPATPAAITKLVSAQPFKLGQSYQSNWRAEPTAVSSGYLLVLQVNPDLVYPHQIATPVLFVGKQTGEAINIGYDSGYVVVIVPAPLDDKGQVDLDLTKTMIWYGEPGLPEQTDAVTIEIQHRQAMKAGIKPPTAKQVEAAIKTAGAGTLNMTGKGALLRHAATLITKYAPTEKSLADNLAREPSQ